MAKAKVFKPKPIPWKSDGATAVESGGEREPDPVSLCIPVPKEWASKYKAGDTVCFEVEGTIKGIEIHEPEKSYQRNEIRLENLSIEDCSETDSYEDLLDDEKPEDEGDEE